MKKRICGLSGRGADPSRRMDCRTCYRLFPLAPRDADMKTNSFQLRTVSASQHAGR